MTAPAYFNTPDRLITYAMKDAGLIGEGDEPTSEQLAEMSNRLNDVINMLQTRPSLKLWTQQDLNVPLTAGTKTYTLGPSGSINMTKPLRVLQGYYDDTTTTPSTRRPIFPLSWQEWLTLSTVDTQGAVSQFFVDKQQLLLSVSFWLTPDTTAASNGSAHLLIQNQLTNFTGVTDALNFTQESFLGLRWSLADEICTGQPQTIMDRCAQRAEKFTALLEDWDVEDVSTTFQPDTRGGQGASRFR